MPGEDVRSQRWQRGRRGCLKGAFSLRRTNGVPPRWWPGGGTPRCSGSVLWIVTTSHGVLTVLKFGPEAAITTRLRNDTAPKRSLFGSCKKSPL